MDNIVGTKFEAGGDACFTRRTRRNSLTRMGELRTRFRMNGAADASAREQVFVRGIDDRINIKLSDVADDNLGIVDS